MRLLKVIERPLKQFGKCQDVAVHIKDPTEFELEQAIARCNINGYDTLIIYK